MKKLLICSLFFLPLHYVCAQILGQYQYDGLGRVTQVVYDNGTTITYTYDALGNRTGKDVTGSIFQITTLVNPIGVGSVIGNLGTYTYNDNVELIAMPLSAEYDFVNWTEGSDEVCVTPTFSFPATQSRVLCANFIQRHQVGVSVYPSSAGQVSGSGRYTHGTQTMVHAESSDGYSFLYWTDDATGMIVSRDSNYTFVVNVATNLTAHFSALHLVSALVNPDDAGRVDGGGYYLHDSVATIVAIPNPGFVFNNWTDGGTSVSSDSIFSFPVLCNIALTANFFHEYRVVTSASPIIGGHASGFGTYTEGSLVSVTAESNDHFRFSHWSQNDTVVSIDSTYSFIITRHTNLVAHFVMQHQVDIVANPISGGDVVGSGVYDDGAYAHIQAVPREGYIFSRWTESDFPLPLSAIDSVLVNADRTLVANFVRNYQVSASVHPESSGNVNGVGMYNAGSLVVLNAVAEPYWTFSSWTDDNNNVVSTHEMVYFSVARDTHLTANFIYTPPTFIVNAYPQPSNAGEVSGMGSYMLDTLVTMTAVPNVNYSFQYWLENDSVVSFDSVYVFNISSNKNLVAVFDYTPIYYDITAVAFPAEGGIVNGANSYPFATTAVLSVSANEDWTFMNWTESGAVIDTNTAISFTVSRSRDLVANFLYTPPVCNVTVGVEPENAGWIADVSGMPFTGGVFNPHDTLMMLALNSPCYHFQYWSIGDSFYSNIPILSVVLDTDVQYVAHFENDTIGKIGEIYGPPEVCANSEHIFSTNNVTEATSYHWIAPDGSMMTTREPSVSLRFDSSSISGMISVSARNNCVEGDTAFFFVKVLPSYDFVITDTVTDPLEWEGEVRTESGTYTVSYLTIGGCDSSITLQLTITPEVYINNIVDVSSIKVYPNPTMRVVNLDLSDTPYDVSKMVVSIFDNLGRELYSDQLHDKITAIDISKFSAGDYYLHLYHEGSKVSTHKIVVGL